MTGTNSPHRLGTVLRWPLGIALVSWRYMWRTTPLHRSEEMGGIEDLPERRDQDTEPADGRQGLDQGVGPMLHRSYAVRIIGSPMSPPALMDMVAANLNRVSPETAAFHKTQGAADDSLRYGDEFVVRMPGPWDGPVRVVNRDAVSFRLATLPAHLEAGEIEFRAARDGDALCFEIESWARAGDRLADLLYNRLRLAKEIQLNMWSHFCVQAATLARGMPQGGVTIRTRWVPWPPPSTPAPTVERVVPPKAAFAVVNSVMRAMLKSPLHPLAGSGRIALLTYTGRKSGRTYTTPVGVHELDGRQMTLTSSGWRVNFREPAPVTLHRRGADVRARASLLEDPDSVAAIYQALIERLGHARAGRQLGIRINVDRTPTLGELADAARRSGLSAVIYDAIA